MKLSDVVGRSVDYKWGYKVGETEQLLVILGEVGRPYSRGRQEPNPESDQVKRYVW